MAEREFPELIGYSSVVRPGARTGEQTLDSTIFSGYAVPDVSRASQLRTCKILPGEAAEPPTSANIAYDSSNAAKLAEDKLQTTARKSTSVPLLLAALIVFTLILAVVGVTMATVSLLNTSNSSELEALQLVVNELQQSFTARDAEVRQLRAAVANLSADNEALTSRVDFSNTNTTASLAGLGLYSGCSTAVEATCTVPPGSDAPGFLACETPPININSSSILEAYCARTDLNHEVNPVVATLRVDRDLGMMLCKCWVVVPSDSFSQTTSVTCDLFVTRCALIQT